MGAYVDPDGGMVSSRVIEEQVVEGIELTRGVDYEDEEGWTPQHWVAYDNLTGYERWDYHVEAEAEAAYFMLEQGIKAALHIS